MEEIENSKKKNFVKEYPKKHENKNINFFERNRKFKKVSKN